MSSHLYRCVECGNIVWASSNFQKPPYCPACGANRNDDENPWTPYNRPSPGESDENAGKEKDDIYHDRNLLACALVDIMSEWTMGGWTPAEEDGDEWAVVWLELPYGQVSWHIPREMAEQLVTRNDNYEYDGHSREEKNDTLTSWVADNCPK